MILTLLPFFPRPFPLLPFSPPRILLFSLFRVYHPCKSPEALNLKLSVDYWPVKIEEQVVKAQAVMDMRKVDYSTHMSNEQDVFTIELVALKGDAETFEKYVDVSEVAVAAQHCRETVVKLEAAEEAARTFNSRESLFEQEMTEYTEIGEIRKIFDPYNNLWTAADDWIQGMNSG